MKKQQKNNLREWESQAGWNNPLVRNVSTAYLEHYLKYDKTISIIHTPMLFDVFLSKIFQKYVNYGKKQMPEIIEPFIKTTEGTFKGLVKRHFNDSGNINLESLTRTYEGLEIKNYRIPYEKIYGITISIPKIPRPDTPPEIILFNENVLGIDGFFGGNNFKLSVAKACANIAHKYNCWRQKTYEREIKE
ncbi:MAG: hypothetical protein ACP5NV_05650 [Candidatus Woesearchaeota archaeon]